MAALTAARVTLARGGPTRYRTGLVAANVQIWAGALVSIVSGYCQDMVSGATLQIYGVAMDSYNNLGGAAGAIAGTFAILQSYKFNNGTGALTQANCGTWVYADDDHTVSSTSGSQSKVGIMEELDVDGSVWVFIDGHVTD